MSVSTADKVFLCVGLIDFGGIFIWLGVALHIAYSKMDLMLGHLKNCPAVMIRAFLINVGPWGRLHVLSVIMGLMVMPRIYLRDGGANADDLKNFPADIKRKLIILHRAGWPLLLVMCGLAGVAKFGRG